MSDSLEVSILIFCNPLPIYGLVQDRVVVVLQQVKIALKVNSLLHRSDTTEIRGSLSCSTATTVTGLHKYTG
jgi:hypothetical protein